MILPNPNGHIVMDELVSAGIPPTSICGAVGNQGTKKGVHGNPGDPAAIAATTTGLILLVHSPHGTIMVSKIVAGIPPTKTRRDAIRAENIVPQMHCS